MTWRFLGCFQNIWKSRILQELSDYAEATLEEQSEFHVTPKQASPIEFSKLIRLAEYLDREIKSTVVTLKDKFLFLRDKAFFLLQFYTGSRGGDLTKLLVQEIHLLADNLGLVIRETWEVPYGKIRNHKKMWEI